MLRRRSTHYSFGHDTTYTGAASGAEQYFALEDIRFEDRRGVDNWGGHDELSRNAVYQLEAFPGYFAP